MPLSIRSERLLFITAALLLWLASVFGGGGAGFPLPELIINIAGVAALAVGLLVGRGRLVNRDAVIPMILLGLLVLLIAAHLVPLPPSVWTYLPGRQTVAATAEALGTLNSYRPLSIDPEATVRSALSLLPAVAIFLLALLLSTRGVRWLILFVASLGMVHLLVGLLQIGSGGTGFYPYPESHEGVATGLFANRNHFGLLLLLVIPCAAVAARGAGGG